MLSFKNLVISYMVVPGQNTLSMPIL